MEKHACALDQPTGRRLTALAKKYSRNTVAHVRSTMSGIFSHAASLSLVTVNPIRESRALVKARAPQQTGAYTLEELENVVTALMDEPDLQLMVCLAGFAGLRPGEIEALRFEDFDADFVHVRRATSRGVVGAPKTEDSVASVPLLAPVKLALAAWRAQCGVTEGWLFPGRFGARRPGDLRTRIARVKEICTEKNVPFKTLYCGRRGLATLLTQLTGNPLAAAQALRHTNSTTTMKHYIKMLRAEVSSGMKLLEEKLGGA